MSKRAIPVLAALLLLGTAALWYWWPRAAPAPTAAPAVMTPARPEAAAAIANPLPPAAENAAALPDLAASDQPLAAAIATLPNASALGKFLRPENLIRHLVATVDNLPRRKIALELRPLDVTGGALLVTGDDQQATLDERNAARYAPLMGIVSNLDMREVNTLYRQYYPLFQRAYQDLGYPNGYFNDRLVSVIDHLLQTPQPTGNLALVRPKVFWEFADPELESRSAGQKIMLRLGNDNAAVVRRKLQELRALIATAPPQSAP